MNGDRALIDPDMDQLSIMLHASFIAEHSAAEHVGGIDDLNHQAAALFDEEISETATDEPGGVRVTFTGFIAMPEVAIGFIACAD